MAVKRDALSFSSFCTRKFWRLVYRISFCLPGSCLTLILLSIIGTALVVPAERQAELELYQIRLRRSQAFQEEIFEKAREVQSLLGKNMSSDQAFESILTVLQGLSKKVERCAKEEHCSLYPPEHEEKWRFSNAFFFVWFAVSSVLIIDLDATVDITRLLTVFATLIGIPVYVNSVENAAEAIAEIVHTVYLKHKPDKRREIEEMYRKEKNLPDIVPMFDDEGSEDDESSTKVSLVTIGDYLLFGLPRYISIKRKVESGKYIIKAVDKEAYFQRQTQQEAMRNKVKFHYSFGLAAFSSYLLLGVLTVVWLEEWSILESLSFIITRMFTLESDMMPGERKSPAEAFALRACVVIYSWIGLSLTVAVVELTDFTVWDQRMRDTEIKSMELEVEKKKGGNSELNEWKKVKLEMP